MVHRLIDQYIVNSSLAGDKQKVLLIWGLKNGLITPYDDQLIEKLRN